MELVTTVAGLSAQTPGLDQEGGETERVEEPVPSLSAKPPPQLGCTSFVPCPKVQFQPGWGLVLKARLHKIRFIIFSLFLKKNFILFYLSFTFSVESLF